jgi:predicted deacetylase
MRIREEIIEADSNSPFISSRISEGPAYLLRFDDLCPTMNWRVWDNIEPVLVDLDIKPILAVVPDNQDPKLRVGPPADDFWERVRQWQGRNWAIALHGYQHRYVNRNAGLLRFPKKSEFAGLPRPEQEFKLRTGLAKFAQEGVRADAWIAPCHSFDKTTLQLLSELGISIISDGFSRLPFQSKGGLTWVPQQLWSFQPRKQGVWTICIHFNQWTKDSCDRFKQEATRFRPWIKTLEGVVARWRGRPQDLQDHLNQWLTLFRLSLRNKFGRFRPRWKSKNQAKWLPEMSNSREPASVQ